MSLRCAKLYSFDSRCAFAKISEGLEAGSEWSTIPSRPVDIVPTALRDTTLLLQEVGKMIVEHTDAIVLLIMILRAQKVTVVLAMARFAKDSRCRPSGPGAALGHSERIIVGVGQYDEDGVLMMNSSYQMSRLVSMPRHRWRK